MTRSRSYLLLAALVCAFAAGCAALATTTTPTAASPATLARRCDDEMKNVFVLLAKYKKAPDPEIIDELRRVGETYLSMVSAGANTEAAACRLQLEPLMTDVAMWWSPALWPEIDDRWCHEVLGLRQHAFPDAAEIDPKLLYRPSELR